MKPAARTNAVRIVGIALVAILTGGCANWKPLPNPEPNSLPLTEVRESKKQLILEFQFVKVEPQRLLEQHDKLASASQDSAKSSDQTPDASVLQEMLWQTIDETKVDLETRRRLIANGIRVGYAADQERFRKTIESSIADQDVVDRFFDEAEIASDVVGGIKRTPMPMGRRHELPLQQPMQGSHVALVRLGEETIGRTLVNPQYLFSITPTRTPSRHSEVTLNLRPEIQHGDVRQRYVRSDRALRIDASRETWSIADLDLQLNVREGDVLVLGPADQEHGMGSHMFASETQSEGEHVLLLIRAAQVPNF